MRALLIPALLIVSSCGRSGEEADKAAAQSGQASAQVGLAVYAGSGRDRLCVRAEQDGPAGFITFAGSGDSNCMVRGTYDRQGAAILPNGDTSCRIPLTIEGSEARLGAGGPSCAYYCGPNASYSGKAFSATRPGTPATDLTGEPLC